MDDTRPAVVSRMRIAPLAALGLLTACREPPATLVDACSDWRVGPRLGWFEDVAGASDIDFVFDSVDFRGNGIAVADVDRDGRLDVIAGSRHGRLALYRNIGDLDYADDTERAGLDATTPVTALAASDLDNDGDPDLALATPRDIHILENTGRGEFSIASTLAHGGTIEHVLPVDIDGDGRLDLYLSNREAPSSPSTNLLLANAGKLQYSLAARIGDGLAWASTAFDVDRDGDQDLYVANDALVSDFGSGPGPGTGLAVDLLLRNDGIGPDGVPILVDVAGLLGLDEPRSSMGHTVADLDGDRELDIYVTNYGAKKLLSRVAGGGFRDRAAELGLQAARRASDACPPDSTRESCLYLSWSAATGDFDLDGLDEVVVASGLSGSPAPPPSMMMKLASATGTYEPIAPIAGCDDARGLVAADLDRDGDLDLVLSQRAGPLRVLANRADMGGAWLGVSLEGGRSNRDGLGAVVRVHLADGRTVMRLVTTGGSVHSSGPAEVHVGVGDGEVERVEVEWPSGRRSVVDRPTLRTSIVIAEPP